MEVKRQKCFEIIMKIDEGFAILKLEPNVPNVAGFMYPVLIWDERDVVLVDAGLPGQGPRLLELISDEGVQPDRLTKIFITHQDMDHIGGLSFMANETNRQGTAKTDVLSHELEKPYIQGEKMPIKFTKEMREKLEKQLEELPEEKRAQYQSTFGANKPAVTGAVSHGQEFDCCGGISIIHIPGHTPGHIAIYLKKYKTLVAGDALNTDGTSLIGPAPAYTYDIAQAIKSLVVLKEYDIQKIVCYHGGLLTGNINEQIEKIAQGT